jgi:predicted PolB exonuclease-like 3'-5' exonuclease
MKPSLIVWDLETVPDLGGFAAANDLVGKSDVEVREAIGDKFPKHIYHAIVCIGALIAHWEQDHWAVDAVGFFDGTVAVMTSFAVGLAADYFIHPSQGRLIVARQIRRLGARP